ncbi:MAG: D-alanine--D-alanine ligase [Clostridia bacterium]|nr:D-alanine--D-alanine ligase [Clostridia bacterium]
MALKVNVGVLFGGKSVEHEVSVISGLQAYRNLDQEKYRPIAIYISKKGEMYVGDKLSEISSFSGDINALLKESTRVTLVNDGGKINIVRYPAKTFAKNILDTIDVALPVVHGTNVEDGTLSGFLHSISCPYAGCDILSSALGMDKYAAKMIMKAAGLPVLDCVVFSRREYQLGTEKVIGKIEAQTRYPVIVKPVNLGSSVGIKKASDKEALVDALEYAFEFADRVLVENAVINMREINCSVLGDKDGAKASECEEPINHDEILSYADKYLSGGKGSKGGSKSAGMADTKRLLPAPISDEMKIKVQEYAVGAFMSLGCSGVSRVDFLVDKDTDEIYINEINTIPGSLSFYLWEATGLKYPDLLDELIRLALKREREEEKLNFSFDTNILSGVSLGGAKGKA